MNKRLIISTILLLICVASVLNFSATVNANDEHVTEYSNEEPVSESSDAPTPTPTCLPTPTDIPTLTPTEVPSPTPTNVPSATPTPTVEPTSVPNQSQTQTQTTNVYNTQIVESKVIETTRGGHPIYAAKPVKTTPSTGPETIALLSLIPSVAAGTFLRRKSVK